MGLIEIEKEIAALSTKARNGTLALEDMTGGTFTMCVLCFTFIVSPCLRLVARFSSNAPAFGSLYGTPIINLPQSAVIGTPHFAPPPS